MTGISDPRPDSKELERLLMRMSCKDEAAFEQLHAATKRKLFTSALLIVKHRHLAEEVLQEAYVRIWLNATAYRPSLGSPMQWMITIARNLAIDIVRKSLRENHSDDSVLENFRDDGPTALETIEIRQEQNDARRDVFIALQAIHPNKRYLLTAAYIGGESRYRLSERYGVPVSTIKTWIRRAVLEVRANLREEKSSRPSSEASKPTWVELPRLNPQGQKVIRPGSKARSIRLSGRPAAVSDVGKRHEATPNTELPRLQART